MTKPISDCVNKLLVKSALTRILNDLNQALDLTITARDNSTNPASFRFVTRRIDDTITKIHLALERLENDKD